MVKLQALAMTYAPDPVDKMLSQQWAVGHKVGFMFKPMIKSDATSERYVTGVITRMATDFRTCWVQSGKDEYIGVPLDRLTDLSQN